MLPSCIRIDEVEDLALGILDPAAAASAEAHLAECPACHEAHAELLLERALFADRAEAMREEMPPPRLALEALPAVRPRWDDADRRTLVARITPAILAVAACFAAVVNIDRLQPAEHRLASPGHRASAIVREPGAGTNEPTDALLSCEPPAVSESPADVVSHAMTSLAVTSSVIPEETKLETSLTCEPSFSARGPSTCVDSRVP